MPTALDLVAKLEVQSMVWAPNQARTLEAFHCVPYNSGSALAIGTEVTYTDTDLGFIFSGKIIDRKKSFSDGEGWQYSCADLYRTLAKSPAKILYNAIESAKIQIGENTSLSDAVTSILSQYASLFPGGVTNSVPDILLPKIDKGGQDVDSWIDDLLDFTEGGIAYVDPNGGIEKLILKDFYAGAAVPLTIGTYGIINPATGELVVQGGSAGESLNRKVEKYTVEGAGQFTRHVETHVSGDAIRLVEGLPLYQMKFFIPEDRVLKRYLREDGTCADGFGMKFRIGSQDSSGKIEVVIDNPQIARDSATGKLFFWVIVSMGGASLSGEFTAPETHAWLTYTSYDGPFPVTVTDPDPALANEGELVEMHCEFFKYTSDDGNNFDLTADATALATQLHKRFSGVDQTGGISVHVKGLNSNLTLGSSISTFSGMRVRSIAYDFIDRSMGLEMSSLPLRENIKRAKQLKKGLSVERNDWYANKAPGEGCFCGIDTFLDEDGIPVDPDPLNDLPGDVGSGDAGGGAVSTWDCQFGNCIEVDGPNGQYKNFDDCERVCGTNNRVQFVPCMGCMQVEDPNAEFDDQDACALAHPDPLDGCLWNCTGPHEDVPRWRCQPDLNGEYASDILCQAECTPPEGEPGGSGSGGNNGSGIPSSGAASGPAFSGSGDVPSGREYSCNFFGENFYVNAVQVDRYGHFVGIVCGEVSGGGGCSGALSGDVVVVCDVLCESGNFTVKKTTLTYDEGCLVSCVSDCAGGCS